MNAADVIESARSAEWINQERELRVLAAEFTLTASEAERFIGEVREMHFKTMLRGMHYTCPPDVSHADARQIEAMLHAWAAEAVAKRRILMARVAELLIELELARRT